MKRTIAMLLAAVLVLGMIPFAAAAVAVTGIQTAGMTKIRVGQTVKWTASVLPANATDKFLWWTAGNPGVATVDQNGVITGKRAGQCNITITAKNGVKKTLLLTVGDIPVTGIQTAGVTKIKVGEKVKWTASVLPVNATNKSLVWKAGNPGVATVDQNGNITAHKAGQCHITIFAGNNVKKTILITVINRTAADKLTVEEAKKFATEFFRNKYPLTESEIQKATRQSGYSREELLAAYGKVTDTICESDEGVVFAVFGGTTKYACAVNKYSGTVTRLSREINYYDDRIHVKEHNPRYYGNKYLYFEGMVFDFDDPTESTALFIYDIQADKELCRINGEYWQIAGGYIFTIHVAGVLEPLPLKRYNLDGSNPIIIAKDAVIHKCIGNAVYYSAVSSDFKRMQLRKYDIKTGVTTNLTDFHEGYLYEFNEEYAVFEEYDKNLNNRKDTIVRFK